jgi:hypothetical protein
MRRQARQHAELDPLGPKAGDNDLGHDLAALSARGLMMLSAAAHDELRARGVIRTSNATGDYAENLFAKAFGWQLERNSNAGFDASHGGTRFQVKCRRITSRNPSRQLGEFGNLEKARFDVLAAVLFQSDFSILRAALVPFDVVRQRSTIVLDRSRFYLRDPIWDEPGVQDVTADLKRAEEAL